MDQQQTFKKEELFLIPILKVTAIDLKANTFKHKTIKYGIFIKKDNTYIQLSSGKVFEELNILNMRVGIEGVYKPLIKKFEICFAKTFKQNDKLSNYNWTLKDIEKLEEKINSNHELSL